MLITFTHDFHSIKKGLGIYIQNDEHFPIRLCEETLSSESVRALEHLNMVEVVRNSTNQEEEDYLEEDFDDPNALCTGCPTCEGDPSYHDDIGY